MLWVDTFQYFALNFRSRILTRTLFAAPPLRDFSIHTTISIYNPSLLTSSSSVDDQKQSEPSGLGGLLRSLLPWKKGSSTQDSNNNNPLEFDEESSSVYYLDTWEPRLQMDCLVDWTLFLRSSWGPSTNDLVSTMHSWLII